MSSYYKDYPKVTAELQHEQPKLNLSKIILQQPSKTDIVILNLEQI